MSNYGENYRQYPNWDVCAESSVGLDEWTRTQWKEDYGGSQLDKQTRLACGEPNQVFDRELEWSANNTARARYRVDGGPWSAWQNDDGDGGSLPAPPRTPWEHCDITFQRPYIANMSETIRKNAQTTIELLVGGRGGTWRQGLIELSVSATSMNNNENTTTTIPPQTILVAGRRPSSDGKLYLAAMDNSSVDLTPQISGNRHYHFMIAQTRHRVTIIANGGEPLRSDIVSRYANYSVGQKMVFKTMTTPSISGLTAETHRWNLSGNYVNAVRFWDVNTSLSWVERTCHPQRTFAITSPRPAGASKEYVVNGGILADLETGAWWIDGGDVSVRCAVQWQFANGQIATTHATGKLRMWRPSVWMEGIIRPRSFHVTSYPLPSVWTVSLGNPNTPAQNGAMQFFVASKSVFDGEFGITQLCQLEYIPGNLFYSDYRRDGPEFYNDVKPVLPNIHVWQYFDDGPFNTGALPVQLKGQFKVFCRFRPAIGNSAENIFVTLGIVTWSMNAKCVSQGPPPAFTVKETPDPVGPNSSTEFPKWDSIQ